MPTNLEKAASLMATWTRDGAHMSPILWSVWNEPGHTLNQVNRYYDTAGNKSYPNETKDQYQQRKIAQRTLAVSLINNLYQAYYTSMHAKMYIYDKIGFGSFLAGDFMDDKVTEQ
jgi:beta-galactosidase/beta-glucuronidase